MDCEDIAEKRGSCAMLSFEYAHAVLLRSWGRKEESRARADDAIACRRGWSWKSIFDNDHAVFDSSPTRNNALGLMDADDIAFRSGMCLYLRRAHAHGVFEMPCGGNSRMRARAAEDIA
mmetsp:Transcript_54753/g.154114  ORF Transcript_54753/g.154114 Transcript_54753/m.154114 type:complete len:119 (-) Transcript_54753:357-713(-)